MKKTQAMKKIAVFLGVALVTTVIMAESEPIQLSLTPEIALYDRATMINGLALSVWGENQQNGLALGIINGSFGQSAGLSVGVINYAENYKGVQGGLINFTEKNCGGWQGGPLFGLLLSVVNYTGGTMEGFQCGLVNYAGTLTGLQFGVVNYAEIADSGVQIGVLNIMPQNECFTRLPDELAPAMILVNWRF